MRLLADYRAYAQARAVAALQNLAPPFRLVHDDCRRVMATMPDASVDAVITDSPYHLTSIVKRFGSPSSARQQWGTDGAYARAARGFMGQTWDGGDLAFDPTLWAEVLRILKPGGYLLSFGGSRTYHRMACAVEDAGFEIRDQIIWLYGSGFPKSKDQGDGWGTALKPAHEPIVMARRPLIGSCPANRALYGTGAINIDGCLIPTSEPVARIGHGESAAAPGYGGGLKGGSRTEPTTAGRFPANVIHDGSDAAVGVFPAKAGAASPVRGDEPSMVTRGIFGKFNTRVPGAFHADQGGAARFFYCAKASGRDRDEGCEHLPRVAAGMVSENSGQHLTRRDEGYEAPRRANHHPTVKPTLLMRYLCRLVTPAGGVIFDPFTGSGSTGKAAMLEGFRFVGAEITADYIPIARARITHALALHRQGAA